MRSIKEKIMRNYLDNGRTATIYSPVVDSYKKGTHCVPYSWGEDYFIKVAPNPGGNKVFIHFGRRLLKRVGGRWIVNDTYYKIKNKEVNSKRELEFILNSKIFTEFANSVNWE